MTNPKSPKGTIPVPVQTVDKELLPQYATEGASGADLKANIEFPLEIPPGESSIIPTGIRCDLPEGFELQVRPRSGFAAKHQVTVLNTPGTIDNDFRGEICVILINHGKLPFRITPKMRIAQLVIAPVVKADFFIFEEELSITQRGEGGFGHTG
ncbi:MAG: dUTP diphosphatase, partial [Chlamydiia bacterium]|nr:dUTP diphosphatase [Chlamydiia bacterium]